MPDAGGPPPLVDPASLSDSDSSDEEMNPVPEDIEASRAPVPVDDTARTGPEPEGLPEGLPEVTAAVEFTDVRNFIEEINFFRAIIEEPVKKPKRARKKKKRTRSPSPAVDCNFKTSLKLKDANGEFVFYPKLTGLANAYIENWSILQWDRLDKNSNRLKKNLVTMLVQLRNKVPVSELDLNAEEMELVGDAVNIFYLKQKDFIEKVWSLYGLCPDK